MAGRTIAKSADVKCGGCGHRFRAFLSERNDWKDPCPECGNPVSEEHREIPRGPALDRRFFGQQRESIREGFHPSEVGKARELFKGVPVEIRSDGVVCADNRADMRAYYRRKREVAGMLRDRGEG